MTADHDQTVLDAAAMPAERREWLIARWRESAEEWRQLRRYTQARKCLEHARKLEFGGTLAQEEASCTPG